ncbi:MAG TPA: permease-like cell division protein FtsX [Atribacteraceae bacterium]|nr:permease-like cell division protein FtsX [Atribacteraceae bacterium]
MFLLSVFHRMQRSPHLFLMGFFSIFFTQLIVNIFIFGYLELEKMGAFLGEAFTVKAYFEDTFSSEQIEPILTNIRNFPETREVVLVDREEARRRFLEYFELREEDFPPEDNPFPQSLEVTSRRLEEVPRLAERLREIAYFEEVIHGGRNLETFIDFYQMLLGLGSFILLGIFIFSLIVIINVIRISIHSCADEIRVSYLMGATERFIRRPFLYEGFSEGFFAGIASFFLSYFVLSFSLEFLHTAFPFFPWITLDEAVWPMAIANTGLGGFIGFLGSYLATGAILRRSEA